MAATYLAKIVVGPAMGHLADRGGRFWDDRRRPMMVLAAAAALAWLLFSLADGFWPVLALTLLAVGLWTGLFPLGESLALQVTHAARLDYGRVRLWGSLAFIGSAIAVGAVLTRAPPSVLVWLVAAALGVTALACRTLPPAPVRPAGAGAPLRLRPLLVHPLFLAFLAVASLGNAGHTVYYAFATIHWRDAGLDGDTIGLLWAEGVIAEVALFAFSGRVVARMGPARLLLIAALAGVVRWLALAGTVSVPALAAAQLLHAATFGCGHLGAMHFLLRAVPAALAVRAQGALAAVAVGVAPAVMSPLAGRLYASLDGGAFAAMALVSVLGSGLALWLLRRWNGGELTLPVPTAGPRRGLRR